jgi:glycosyltransferase involved in cell wall biosynthesis
MFSVIIPLYNKAPYIEKAIRSVAAQTCQEFELIVIDDGSQDDPLPPKGGNGLQRLSFLENCSEFLKKVRIVEQKNQGVSVTRNNGVELAKYDYIAFLDADDWWVPTFLEEMKALITQYPEAGIYGSSYFKVKNGKYIPANIGVEAGFQNGLINYFQVYAKTLWMPLTSISVVIKKNVFVENNGFKPSLKLGEDFDLWARVAIKYPVAFLNKPLAYYNQDVILDTRAVGARLYEKHEHMLFTQYDKALTDNVDFRFLFERLALYGLLKYYMAGKHRAETKEILKQIDWSRHEKKYYLYYKVLSPAMVRCWFGWLKQAWLLKQRIRKLKKSEMS